MAFSTYSVKAKPFLPPDQDYYLELPQTVLKPRPQHHKYHWAFTSLFPVKMPVPKKKHNGGKKKKKKLMDLEQEVYGANKFSTCCMIMLTNTLEYFHQAINLDLMINVSIFQRDIKPGSWHGGVVFASQKVWAVLGSNSPAETPFSSFLPQTKRHTAG